ncbi:DNA-binding NarL/FixJ family response regulator [Flavobacterium arsenatis]|uniref:DNA-binding NarL/FixJ family response regulator n=1 Tax=Flavobacterium arsenatis TaxID=1484332 RepID=A0ABU1TN73_9FLAO|nr:response regulator transcription factor [Flavobacterium arsenatis]MDR6967385.1 DNA-binding NarL/FixJ family response regulator [Flavobacterium arsenatis]
MSEKIQIIVVDDEVLFRKGIIFLLERKKNINIVFEAGDGEELIEYLNKAKVLPDIILMDINMPIINGVEATKTIRKEFPEIKIIALTSYHTPLFIANMIQEGVASYLIKNAHPDEMIKTISEVANKGFYYNENVLKVLSDNFSPNKKILNILSDDFLTSREREVLELICRQHSTAEIAEKIFISPRTVESHRNSLLLKTQTKNVAGLVVFALQNKIVQL